MNAISAILTRKSFILKLKNFFQKKSTQIVSVLLLISLTTSIFLPNQQARGTDYTPSSESYQATPSVLNNTLANYQTTAFVSPTDYNKVATDDTSYATTTATSSFVCGTSTVTRDGLTYGTVLGADGKCWLDRNLGATQKAIAFNDSAAYGWLFQWGRGVDGHQIVTSLTTTTNSSTDVPVSPDNNKFITETVSPYDWRTPQNDNLWQGVNGTNNPCPTGFRLPTSSEWSSLVGTANITNYNTAYGSSLKLTAAGIRSRSDAALYFQGSYGFYWASSLSGGSASDFDFSSSVAIPSNVSGRANAFSVRCIEDLTQVANPCPSTMSDNDGNTYTTVAIGNQCWMRENLMTAKYPDGTNINNGTGSAIWDNTDRSYYAYPPNVSNSAEADLNSDIKPNKLGFLYQWSAVMHGSITEGAQGVCPADWHVPTDQEYKTMEMSLNPGMTQSQADAYGWRGTDQGTQIKTISNTTLGVPLAGLRNPDGSASQRGAYGVIVTSTSSGSNIWRRYVHTSYATINRDAEAGLTYASSVRCIKNTSPYASQLYTFNPTSFTNYGKLDISLIANATAPAGNGITAKIWNTTLNSGTGGWETLAGLTNVDTSGNMPNSAATQSLASNVNNYVDGSNKIRILLHSTNPSNTTNAILNTDLIKIAVYGAPVVTTNAVSAISTASATGNANVDTLNGENPIRYIEWATDATHTTGTGSCNAGIGSTGTYTCAMTGLTPNTKYYVRAKVTNSGGTGYGTDTTFRTASDIVAVDAGASSLDRTSLTSNVLFGANAIGNDDQASFSWTDSNPSTDNSFYYLKNSTSADSITNSGLVGWWNFDNGDVAMNQVLTNNREFTSDTSGWTAPNGTMNKVNSATTPGTSSVTAGAVDAGVLKLVDDGSHMARAYQAITTVVGKKYRVKGLVYRPSTSGDDVVIGAGTSNAWPGSGAYLWNLCYAGVGASGAFDHTYDSWVEKSCDFQATGTTTYIGLIHNPALTGSIGYFDKMSVTELGIADSSGSNNSSSLMNGTTYNANGQLGASGSFDGTDDHVIVADNASLNFGTSNFSVGAWVKTSATGERAILNKVTLGGNYEGYYLIQSSGSKPAFEVRGLAGNATIVATTSINDNNWHFVMGVREGNTVKIYIDGISEGTPVYNNFSNANTNNLSDIKIGKIFTETVNMWTGQMDEIKIYNRALTQAEVTNETNLRRTTNNYIDNIALTEGTQYLHVKPFNTSNAWGVERTFATIYDGIAPTAAPTCTPITSYFASTTGTITCTVGAGGSQIRYTTDNSTPTIASTTWSNQAFTNTTILKVISCDAASNCYATPNTYTYTKDTTGPTGSIANSSGNPTNDNTPTLNLTIADSGVGTSGAQMQFSCDNSTWSTLEAYNATKTNFDIKPASTTYGCTNTDGSKTVYARFQDSLGNTGSSYNTGAFTLDTTAPIISINNPDTTPAQSKTITASTDSGTLMQSGLITGSTCDVSSAPFSAYQSTILSIEADNTKKICYQATDSANNITYLMSNAIGGIDTTAPTGTNNINNDATYTTTTSVTLNNNVSNADQMHFKNQPGDSFSSWFTYAATFAWDLATGDGLKTVYSEFRDLAGNTLQTNDTITLDTTNSIITITNPNTNPQRSKTITAEVDNGTLKQAIITNNTCDGSIETFEPYFSFAFSSEADNGKKICYQAIDVATNISYSLSNAIQNIDTTDPTTSANNNSNNWQTANPTITLQTNDTNLSYSKYAWDSSDATCRSEGSTFGNTDTINIPSQGTHTLYLCNADQATNQSSWNGTYKLDSVAPAIEITSSCTNTTDPTFTIAATDATSDLAATPYSFDGGNTYQTENTKSYQDFNHTIPTNTIKVRDLAGNIATYDQQVSQSCVITPAVSTSTIPNSSITSTNATATADLTYTGGEDPTRYIEWGTESGTYTHQCTANIGATGVYSCAMTNLQPDTTYYFRAKATNSAGTTTGAEQTLHTLPEAITIPDPDPTKITNAKDDNYFTIGTGDLNGTNQATTNLNLTVTTDNGQATLPNNTTITNAQAGDINMADFTITNVTSHTRSTIGTSRGSVEIGIPNTRLSFSQNISITINIDPVYNDEVLQIQSQLANSTTWNDEGTCTVTAGKCSFTTNHATTYTVNGDGTLKGETNTDISLPLNSTISLACTDTLTLNPITGTGQSSITKNNEATCNVKTNNSQGYKLEWSTGTVNLTNANADAISGYSPITPNTPETWNINQANSAWGARIKSTSTDSNTTLWGTTDDYTGNWLNIASSPFQIISRNTETDQAGSDEVIQFGAEIGSNKFQPTGTYSTSVTMTATTL